MSKVNILKIIEGVGACSENLIGISENLISLQSKLRLRNQHQSRLKPRLSR